MRSRPDITGASMLRIGALAAMAGTLIHIAMSILHGNPPIGDASKILPTSPSAPGGGRRTWPTPSASFCSSLP